MEKEYNKLELYRHKRTQTHTHTIHTGNKGRILGDGNN